MAQLAGRRYATALFELGLSENTLDTLEKDAAFMLESLKENPQLSEVLTHPQITFDEKMALVQNIFKDNVSEHLMGLIQIMLKKNREGAIDFVLTDFLRMVGEHKKVAVAEVFSAGELSEAQEANIKKNLEKALNKQVIIKKTVQPDLIGGLYVKADGRIFDSTIKTQLADMRKMLLDLQLA